MNHINLSLSSINPKLPKKLCYSGNRMALEIWFENEQLVFF